MARAVASADGAVTCSAVSEGRGAAPATGTPVKNIAHTVTQDTTSRNLICPLRWLVLRMVLQRLATSRQPIQDAAEPVGGRRQTGTLPEPRREPQEARHIGV